jgi:hypothetical protein
LQVKPILSIFHMWKVKCKLKVNPTFSPYENDLSIFQKMLLGAFRIRKKSVFVRCLKIGLDPELVVDKTNNLSTFELLCCDSDASDYILKCLDYNIDPNRVSHIGVLSFRLQSNMYLSFWKGKSKQWTLPNPSRRSKPSCTKYKDLIGG